MVRLGQESNGHDVQNSYIRLSGVEKEFRTEAGSFKALKGLDLRIEKGEYVGIIGRSGSGKTTLLNLLTGIDRPTAGEIHVGDAALRDMNEDQMAGWRGRHVGIVFQFFQLMPTLTVLENIMLPMDFAGTGTARERKLRAYVLLERVGIGDQAGKLPHALSGGQQQRAAIARALANDPGLLVADEPTGNLDSKTAASIYSLFQDLAREGKTIILVTHEGSVAKRLSRTVTLSDGLVLQDQFHSENSLEIRQVLS